MEDFIGTVLLVTLLLLMLSAPMMYFVFGPKANEIREHLNSWISRQVEWYQSLQEARHYSSRHTPEAVAKSRRARAREDALNQIAYFAEWIQEHHDYLANAKPSF